MPPVIIAAGVAALSTGLATGFAVASISTIIASALIAAAAPGLDIAIDPPQSEPRQSQERS